MKTLSILTIIAALVALLILSGMAVADTVTSDSGLVSEGWNLISLPAFPLDAGPGHPTAVLSGFVPLTDILKRRDAATQTEILWGDAAFGNMLVGDAYWLFGRPGAPDAVSYEGVSDTDCDTWISLPTAGWTDIGNPFGYAVDWADVEVTNGMDTVSTSEAVSRGWITQYAYANDNVTKQTVTLGIPESEAAVTRMEPWQGYSVHSLQDGLALLVPALPSTARLVSLSGSIALGDWKGDAHAVPITVELRDPGSQSLVMRTVLHTSASGQCSLRWLKPGAYDVAVRASHWLKAALYSTELSADMSGLDITLTNGDCNGDNSIGFGDFSILRSAWGSDPDSPNWDTRADLNGDGGVGFADFSVLRKNWGLEGDE